MAQLGQNDFKQFVAVRRTELSAQEKEVETIAPQETKQKKKTLKEESLDLVKSFDHDRKKNKARTDRQKGIRGDKKRKLDIVDKETRSEYRDRAKERRKGEFDFNEDDQLKEMSEEQTKSLGGDVESTHLVKGLDYKLLKKMKEELKQKETVEKKEMKKITTEATHTTKPAEKEHTGIPRARTAVARGILRDMVEEPHADNVEMFLPGRMLYQFDCSEDGAEELPTTILRSKLECPRHEATTVGVVDKELLSKVGKIMSVMGHSHGRRKHRRKEEKQKKKLRKEMAAADDGVVRLNPKTLIKPVKLQKKVIVKKKEEEEEIKKPEDTTMPESDGIAQNVQEEEQKLEEPQMEIEDDDIFPDAGKDYILQTEELEDTLK